MYPRWQAQTVFAKAFTRLSQITVRRSDDAEPRGLPNYRLADRRAAERAQRTGA